MWMGCCRFGAKRAASNALVAEAISIRISTLKARRLSSSFNSAISDC